MKEVLLSLINGMELVVKEMNDQNGVSLEREERIAKLFDDMRALIVQTEIS